MSKTQIVTGGIADDAVSEEHLDATAITGSTELAATPADTDEILISDAGTLKRIDFSLIKSVSTPYFHVHRNGSNQSSVSNNTATVVQWTTETYDTGSHFDNSTNYTWTPSAGTYFVYAQTRFQMNAENDLTCTIQKDGSNLFQNNTYGKYYSGAFCSGLVTLNGSEALRVLAVQYSGSSQDLSGGAAQSWFGGYRVNTT